MVADSKNPLDAERHLPLKPVVFHILLALAEAPRHGLGISEEVEEITAGSMVLGPGTLYRSLKMITEAPQGVFIYLPAGNQMAREDELGGAVWREVGLGSYILSSLGVRRIHLLASRELSFPGVASFGLSIETVIKEV